MKFLKEVRENPGLLPKLLIIIFRFGYFVYHYIKLPIIRQFLIIIYRLLDLLIVKLLLNCDISGKTDIGYGFKIYHPYGIFINDSAKIGDNCTVRGQVTIGNKGWKGNKCPVLLDNIEIGVGAKIIGAVIIESGSQIGTNAVVTKSFPKNSILVGIPAVNLNSKD